jgi:hypothetical protein
MLNEQYDPINLGVLLSEIDGTIRRLELIRLGCLAPAGHHGYVTQLASGIRAVRLDAARQLQRAGINFVPNHIPTA